MRLKQVGHSFFIKIICGFSVLPLLMGTSGCKSGNVDSANKSIIDKNNRVLGLIQTGTEASPKAEFRLCRISNAEAIRTEQFDDPEKCINPYTDSAGIPLVIVGQNFTSVSDAEAYLTRSGYLKGAVIGAAGAAVGVAGGVVLYGFSAAASTVITGAYMTASTVGMMHATGGAVANVAIGAGAAAGGGALGFAMWGKGDRDAANAIGAIMGNFYTATSVSDVKAILTRLAYAAEWSVAKDVGEF